MKLAPLCFGVIGLMLLAGCAVGPRYARPSAPTAPQWKTEAPWQQAAPSDALTKGPWWQVFNDAELSRLEQQLVTSNYSLGAARDRLEQARSLARVATAGYFPQFNAEATAARQRLSANRPIATTTTVAPTSITQNTFEIPFTLNYEVDLFGRVRRTVEAANAQLQSTAADLANSQLVLTSELAADYFTLRELDAEIQVVTQSAEYQRKALQLVENRHQGGVASGLEVAQQQTLLDSTLSQVSLLQQQRAQFEHAIATLVGTPASSFTLAEASFNVIPPAVPLGVPSDVLQRRPDVATAERTMAFQNAQVGIATTAFYPNIVLSASGGVESSRIGTLISGPSALWALGANLAQPIFNGGRNRANLAATQAAYDESVANYRNTVLTAFQQVEDGLSGLNALSQAAATQQAAVQDAQRALDIANNRYTGGVTTYLDVVTAESTLLANQRLATQLLGQRMVTSVLLVKALGGGWDASQINDQQVHPHPGQIVEP
jgi:NodT family efflux transporter outer membrane factor (OMF) lipoprotein